MISRQILIGQMQRLYLIRITYGMAKCDQVPRRKVDARQINMCQDGTLHKKHLHFFDEHIGTFLFKLRNQGQIRAIQAPGKVSV